MDALELRTYKIVDKMLRKGYSPDEARKIADKLINQPEKEQEYYPIGTIMRETAKAVYASIGLKYNQWQNKFSPNMVWIPKSILHNGMVPEWFYNKNN
jgi:hypothetical protein